MSLYRTSVANAALTIILAQAVPAAAATAPGFTIVETQVELARSVQQRAADMALPLQQASDAEAHYYDASLPAAIMRIRIDGVGFRSVGKGVASNLPVVGMFAGENRNYLKGEVELVDRSSGKSLQKFKILCDDSTDAAVSEGLLTYGKVGVSVLPFGALVSAAIDVAQGAANKRDPAMQKLERGFVMLSYRKAYGAALYRSFAPQRKAALQMAATGKDAVMPTPTAVPAAATMPVAMVSPAR